MRDRKVITVILRGLLVTIVGIATFILGTRIGKISMPEQREHEEARSMQGLNGSAEVISDNQERESATDEQE